MPAPRELTDAFTQLSPPVDAWLSASAGGTNGSGAAGVAEGATECRLVQEARFLPRGLLGLAYWYLVLPFHAVVFNGLLAGIARRAETHRAAA